MSPGPQDCVEAGKSVRSRLISWSVKGAVSALALALLLGQIDAGELLGALALIDERGFVAVVGLYLFGQVMTAYRWHFIAARVGFPHRFAEVVRFYFIGMFFTLLAPSTLGGDVVRGLYLAERDGRRVLALNTVVFDRVVGLITLVWLAAVSLAVFGGFGLPRLLLGAVATAALGSAIAWWLLPPLARRVLPARSRVVALIDGELAPYWKDGALVARAAGVSLLFHILQVLALITLGWAAGLAVDWRYYFVFHPLVTILSAVPVSVAGLGVREVGYVWFLERTGVAAGTAVAFGLAWFAVLAVSSLVGGVVYWASGRELPLGRGGASKP